MFVYISTYIKQDYWVSSQNYILQQGAYYNYLPLTV